MNSVMPVRRCRTAPWWPIAAAAEKSPAAQRAEVRS